MTKGCCGTKIKQVYWFYLEWINSQNTSWLFRHGQARFRAQVQVVTPPFNAISGYSRQMEQTTRTLDRWDKTQKFHHLTTFLKVQAHALKPHLTALVPSDSKICNLHHVWLRGHSQMQPNYWFTFIECCCLCIILTFAVCSVVSPVRSYWIFSWTKKCKMVTNVCHFVWWVCYENSSLVLQWKCKCSLGSGSEIFGIELH